MAKKKAARKPRSQSEIASEKRAKALDRAGTAVIEGKRGKADKIIGAATKPRKPDPKQAALILSEAHALEMQITALDLKIEGLKEAYKEAKAQRDVLMNKLRGEVRDMGQGRLPFGASAKSTPATPETKGKGGETNPAKGETAKPENGAPELGGETKPDEIERELEDAPRA